MTPLAFRREVYLGVVICSWRFGSCILKFLAGLLCSLSEGKFCCDKTNNPVGKNLEKISKDQIHLGINWKKTQQAFLRKAYYDYGL